MVKKYKNPDIIILMSVSILILFGLVMIYSSSAVYAYDNFGDFAYFFKKQLVWMLIGFFTMILFINIDYNDLKKVITPFYVLTILLLVFVLVYGKSIGGAQRWIKIGVLTFQPSEMARITVLIMLAYFIDRKRSRINTLKRGILPALVIVGIPSSLILLQPDLGIPFLIVSVCLAMLYMGGAHIKHLTGIVVLSLPMLAFSIIKYPYRLKRMLTFLNPWADPQGAGYQITQSMLALGSGGFAGKGLGGSNIKLLYLPTPHTDFIFPIIGEELGFIGCMALIGLFVLIAVRGLMISRRAANLFGTILCAGFTFMLTFQAFLNLAVATGTLPTKGISLPFLSFGGSSLIFNMAAVGIILNISRQAKE